MFVESPPSSSTGVVAIQIRWFRFNCVVALKERRKGQREERLLSGPNWLEPIPGLVFETVDGRPIDKDNLGHIWGLLLDKANVPRRRLYEARHTAATLLLAQGVHARVVTDLLGHSTIKLTMDTYSHVMPALQREAANAMERALAWLRRRHFTIDR